MAPGIAAHLRIAANSELEAFERLRRKRLNGNVPPSRHLMGAQAE